MKTIICGPPHSGKSVFISNLIKLLPSGHYIRINANGDGEGTWSNNRDQTDIMKVRVKGSNTEKDFLRWKRQIDNASQDIAIIDIGGRLQDDKIPLFESCDSFVVVSNDEQMIEEWKKFGSAHGCKCVGTVLSRLGDLSENIYETEPFVSGEMSGLERGHDISGSRLLSAIANSIVTLSGFKGYQKQSGENIIDMYDLGIKLGMSSHWRTTTGIEVHSVWYKPERAHALHDYLVSFFDDGTQCCHIYGARAMWASCLVASTAYMSGITDIKVHGITAESYIPIFRLPTDEKTKGKLTCSVTENEDYVLLSVTIPKRYVPNSLKDVVLPKLNANKKLLLSGKIPSWLAISIILSYDNDEKYIHSPGIGFIKVYDKENRNYGEIIKAPDTLL